MTINPKHATIALFMTYRVGKMPSSQLLKISNTIEKMDTTDSFGKFQLYLALLNLITGRKSSTLTGNLPQEITFFQHRIHLDTGNIPRYLLLDAEKYAQEFKNNSSSKINWGRYSNIVDSTFIIDQMLVHLRAMSENENQNQAMINVLRFNRQNVIQFLDKVSRYNHLLLASFREFILFLVFLSLFTFEGLYQNSTTLSICIMATPLFIKLSQHFWQNLNKKLMREDISRECLKAEDDFELLSIKKTILSIILIEYGEVPQSEDALDQELELI